MGLHGSSVCFREISVVRPLCSHGASKGLPHGDFVELYSLSCGAFCAFVVLSRAFIKFDGEFILLS